MVNVARIEDLRISRGISKTQLSIQLGYKSHSSYTDKSNSRRNFNLKDLEKMARIFNVSLTELIR